MIYHLRILEDASLIRIISHWIVEAFDFFFFFTISLLKHCCVSHGVAETVIHRRELHPKASCSVLQGHDSSWRHATRTVFPANAAVFCCDFCFSVKRVSVKGLLSDLQVTVQNRCSVYPHFAVNFWQLREKNIASLVGFQSTHKLECFSALRQMWHSSPPPATFLYSVGSAIDTGQSVDHREGAGRRQSPRARQETGTAGTGRRGRRHCPEGLHACGTAAGFTTSALHFLLWMFDTIWYL